MERRSAHNNFSLNPLPQLHIQLSSDFDSGNLQLANVLSISYSQQEESEPKIPVLKLELIPSGQPFNAQYSARQSNKNFFHFNIKSNKQIIIHAHIRRMNILSIIESSFQDCYRVAVGHRATHGSIRYHKADLQSLTLNKIADQYQLPAQQKVYFAYHFPYSYQRMCHYLQDLDEHFKHSQTHNENSSLLGGIHGTSLSQHNNIYFKNELLTQSLEGRQINLLTITELSPALKKSGLINLPRQPRISKSLFPYYDIVERPFKFNKPYILVTSRVHPGQTSASFALEGFVNRLLGSSPEAEFIRKSFVILIVPMINPDGVFHGTYRMDMLGHNLNRFYNSCAAHKQPAIFAISTLLQHHSQQLVAFFDIHSHPQAKGSFAYGNAFTSIQDQTQSQVFAKLLSLNSESFSYQACTFSQKNMNSKDINDILSKDGSARVCAYKKMMNSSLGNGVHCFALELGYHGCPVKKEVNRTEEIYEFKSAYKREVKQFDVNDYMQFGNDLVNTICQVYVQTFRAFVNGQAAVQVQNTNHFQQVQPTYLQTMRQETAKQIFDKEERFRILDSGLLKKIKNIQNLIFNSFYSKIVKKYPAILEIVKDFDTHKPKKQVPKNSKLSKQGQKNIKIVHSLELGKNNFYGSENKRLPYNNQLEEDFKKLKEKLPPRDLNIKNLILRANAQKVSVVPMEFHIPTSSRNASEHRNFRRRDINYNRILEMQADSLPRIQKKKFNLLTERLRLKQKRVQSSINTHNFQSPIEHNILPISRGGLERKMYRGVTHNDKVTIDSNIDDIIQYENIINVDPQEVDEEEYQRHFQQATEEYSSNFNPEFALQMNVVRNQIMFPRQSQLRAKQKIQINPMTERIHHRRLETNEQRKRSKSRQKLVISNQNQNMNLGLNVKALPKLPLKMEKMKNKFDLELKMKQKYDRQYKLDDKIKGEGK